METNDERLFNLLGLKLSGEAGLHELEELDHLLKANPNAGFQADIIEKFWTIKHQVPFIEIAYDKHLQRLSNHLSEPALQYDLDVPEEETKPKTAYRKFFIISALAASLVLAFFALGPSKFTKTQKQPLQNSVSTRLGSKSKIQLPDGTQVWLNSGSNLTYDETFLGKFREVHLSGEAYFDVVKDKEHPFIIHTKNLDIKVLGTAFNVRSYPTDKTSETSLIRGSVEIILHNNPDKKIILKPNEKLVVQNEVPSAEKNQSVRKRETLPLLALTRVHTLNSDTAIVETSWITNILAFDNEPLEQVVQKIERWYDVKVLIKDEELKTETYSMVFEDETVAEVMEALQLAGNFKYKINRKEIVIRR